MSAMLDDLIARLAPVTARRLKKIVINEISAVDKPANEHCRMAIMKRHDERKTDMSNEPIGLLEKMRRAERAARPAPVSEAGQIAKGSSGTAYDTIMKKALAMHEDIPELSVAQCFSRLYQHPTSSSLAKAERRANNPIGNNDYYEEVLVAERRDGNAYEGIQDSDAAPIFHQDPVIERNMAFGALKALSERIRADHPFLTSEQLYVRAMAMRPDLARRERAASRRALGVEV